MLKLTERRLNDVVLAGDAERITFHSSKRVAESHSVYRRGWISKFLAHAFYSFSLFSIAGHVSETAVAECSVSLFSYVTIITASAIASLKQRRIFIRSQLRQLFVRF